MSLAKKKCKPCEGGMKPLDAAAAKKLASDIPEWKVTIEPPRVSREVKFKNFKKAMKFVGKVAELAEDEGHHPDIHIHYNKVTFELWTHDIGGLSENDFIMAAKIDRLLE